MKKILIPILIVIVALFIVAMFLGRSNRANSDAGYHTHEDGSTHYDVAETTAEEYHVHEDGETHYGEH